jgi:hypothetical protein
LSGSKIAQGPCWWRAYFNQKRLFVYEKLRAGNDTFERKLKREIAFTRDQYNKYAICLKKKQHSVSVKLIKLSKRKQNKNTTAYVNNENIHRTN